MMAGSRLAKRTRDAGEMEVGFVGWSEWARGWTNIFEFVILRHSYFQAGDRIPVIQLVSKWKDSRGSSGKSMIL